ncbi:hypothetical protein CASFOL_015906 [Castilleja foliolosa]|uniref:Uncharacterized protein n=1 Tax=Castilleja foliolosa TaxID=1961234 RepID=A0ABD3DFN6_9LAMI
MEKTQPITSELSKPITKSCQEVISLFLTRVHAGYFRITLSLCCQSLLWKILLHPHQNSKITFQVPRLLYSTILTTLWSFSLTILTLLSLIYSLKCFFHFNTVKSEFKHRVGMNYLFAPWISWLLIVESAPFVTPKHISFVILWWVFAVPVVILDLKIYGQWFTRGKTFLIAVANPSTQLSVVGNLVGARAAAKMEWREVSLVLFSLGMVHYLVLFVTLYQQVSGDGDQIPEVLRPVFCLFFAVPSVASLAWYSISGRFDTAAKMLYFLSLFLFASLICRPNLFKKAMSKFNIAWWAYSYTITMLALASVRYEQEVKGGVPRVISISLSALSLLVLFVLIIFTASNPKLLLPDHEDPVLFISLPNIINPRL